MKDSDSDSRTWSGKQSRARKQAGSLNSAPVRPIDIGPNSLQACAEEQTVKCPLADAHGSVRL